MNIVAIKDMCSGNETIGEMWQETKIFDANQPIKDVLVWAGERRKRVVVTLPDGEQLVGVDGYGG